MFLTFLLTSLMIFFILKTFIYDLKITRLENIVEIFKREEMFQLIKFAFITYLLPFLVGYFIFSTLSIPNVPSTFCTLVLMLYTNTSITVPHQLVTNISFIFSFLSIVFFTALVLSFFGSFIQVLMFGRTFLLSILNFLLFFLTPLLLLLSSIDFINEISTFLPFLYLASVVLNLSLIIFEYRRINYLLFIEVMNWFYLFLVFAFNRLEQQFLTLEKTQFSFLNTIFSHLFQFSLFDILSLELTIILKLLTIGLILSTIIMSIDYTYILNLVRSILSL